MFLDTFARTIIALSFCLSVPAIASERVDGPPPPPSIASGWVESVRECAPDHGPPVQETLWSKHDDDFRRQSAIAVAGEILRVELSTTLNVVAVTTTTIYLKHHDGTWSRYDLSRGEGGEADLALQELLRARELPDDTMARCIKMF